MERTHRTTASSEDQLRVERLHPARFHAARSQAVQLVEQPQLRGPLEALQALAISVCREPVDVVGDETTLIDQHVHSRIRTFAAERLERRTRVAVARALRKTEPQLKQAVDEAARVGRGLRAGVRAGAAAYRASARKKK